MFSEPWLELLAESVPPAADDDDATAVVIVPPPPEPELFLGCVCFVS